MGEECRHLECVECNAFWPSPVWHISTLQLFVHTYNCTNRKSFSQAICPATERCTDVGIGVNSVRKWRVVSHLIATWVAGFRIKLAEDVSKLIDPATESCFTNSSIFNSLRMSIEEKTSLDTMECTSSHPICLRTTVIVFSYLRLCLPRYKFQQKNVYAFFVSSCALYVHSITVDLLQSILTSDDEYKVLDLDRSDTEIAGLNPSQSTAVWPCCNVLCRQKSCEGLMPWNV
jgi:hypothetical protein